MEALRAGSPPPLEESAHDLSRKPVPIPDRVEDMLFGIMR
jgi:hypothetical protein